MPCESVPSSSEDPLTFLGKGLRKKKMSCGGIPAMGVQVKEGTKDCLSLRMVRKAAIRFLYISEIYEIHQ